MARSSFGSIKPHGDGKWRVFISEGYGRDGKRRRTSKVFDTKDKAERYLAKKRLEKGYTPDTNKAMTIHEYWEYEYLPMMEALGSGGEIALTSIATRKSHFNAIDKVLGDEVMDGLDQRYIERKLLEIKAPHMRQGALSLLRTMYATAEDDGRIGQDSFTRRTKLSKPKTARQDVLSVDEIAEWLENLKGFRYEAAALIIFAAGLRREEAAALHWDDIRLQNGALYITIDKVQTKYDERHPKTDESARSVIIAEPLASRIEALRGNGYLLQGVTTDRIKPDTLRVEYREWFTSRNLRYVSLRNLRNSYATFRQLIDADPTITSKSMGHANLKIDYDHYLVTQDAAFLKDSEKMGEAICAIMCQFEESRKVQSDSSETKSLENNSNELEQPAETDS